MKDKILKIVHKKYFMYILLALIIFLQLANITRIIVNEKKSCHSDEIFSYGLANSFYEPYLETDGIRTEIGAGHEYNLSNWISGDVIREYVTVQKGEQFRYDSVWYNQSMDRHPPLYYAVMHTICSFFPDTFSFVFGYAINFVCFAVTQIFLYKLSKNILKSGYLALIVCIFWGFSAAAADITMFIRMYCMLSMWTVMFFYLHSELLAKNEKPLWKQLVSIIIVTVCGALTQYLFLFVAFVTAVMFCIRYLCKRQFKIFWAYGFSLLGSAAAAELIYPAYLPNMFAETSHVKTQFLKQFNLCIRYLLDALCPITKPSLIFWIPTLLSIAFALVIMSVPVLYLFRDRDFVKNILIKIKDFPEKLKTFNLKKTRLNILGRVKKINFISWVIIVNVVVVMALTAYSIVFDEMFYIDRYLFIIYPVTALFISLTIYFVFSWSKYKKQILAFILILMTLIRFSIFVTHYTFNDNERIENIKEITKNSECIFVAEWYREIWMMNCLPADLFDVDRLFVTCISHQEKDRSRLESIETDKPIYLLFNTQGHQYFDDEGKEYYRIEIYDDEKDKFFADDISIEDFEKKYTDFYKNLSITKKWEYIGEHYIFYRRYLVYRLA